MDVTIWTRENKKRWSEHLSREPWAPADPFTTKELQNASYEAPELHKTPISWPLCSKVVKGPVRQNYILYTYRRNRSHIYGVHFIRTVSSQSRHFLFQFSKPFTCSLCNFLILNMYQKSHPWNVDRSAYVRIKSYHSTFHLENNSRDENKVVGLLLTILFSTRAELHILYLYKNSYQHLPRASKSLPNSPRWNVIGFLCSQLDPIHSHKRKETIYIYIYKF